MYSYRSKVVRIIQRVLGLSYGLSDMIYTDRPSSVHSLLNTSLLHTFTLPRHVTPPYPDAVRRFTIYWIKRSSRYYTKGTPGACSAPPYLEFPRSARTRLPSASHSTYAPCSSYTSVSTYAGTRPFSRVGMVDLIRPRFTHFPFDWPGMDELSTHKIRYKRKAISIKFQATLETRRWMGWMEG